MPTVILARHGRTAANATGVLAGRSPGVGLDETGAGQVDRAAARLADLPLAVAVTSPMQRCRDTTRRLLARRDPAPDVHRESRLTECDYGEWTGGKLATLAKEPLWRTVQAHPSGVVFPGGESLAAMSARAVTAVREWDARIAAEHGDHAVWLAVSHGDVIKAVLADALAMHLDEFQRLIVEPASLSIVRYTPLRPFVVSMNTHEGSLAGLHVPPPRRRDRRRPSSSSDAAVGGSSGAHGPRTTTEES